jgi:hypothetical protein
MTSPLASLSFPLLFTVHVAEHPLELTEVLNGFGMGGADDAASWSAMLPEVALLAEWLAATRQNRIEWLLLCAADWQEFAGSPLRQQRLQAATAIFTAFGIAAGADLPIIEVLDTMAVRRGLTRGGGGAEAAARVVHDSGDRDPGARDSADCRPD